MRKSIAASMLGIAAVSLSMPVLSAPGQTYINAAAGYQGFDADRDLDEVATGIIGIEHQFSETFGVELKYMNSSPENNYNIEALDTELQQAGIDALYYLGDGEGWEPYLAIGLAHAEFELENNSDIESEETQANVGGGVRYLFNERWSLRGDVRYINALDNEQSDGIASLGLSYAFGGAEKKPEPMPEPAPEPKEMDSDGDGVGDNSDRCPSTPAGVAVNASGCPLDKDGDGVPNYRDKCPDTPAGRQVDEFGCKFVLKRTEQIKMEINFASNSADVPAAFESEIEKVAAFLKKFGGVKAVIEGHSDSTGAAAYNKTLSQRRADSVKAELVTKYGINASRLTAIGYGEERPIASNETVEGRKANRRVVAVMKAEVTE